MITLYTPFSRETAAGILMGGRLEAIQALGISGQLIMQPFKDFRQNTNSQSSAPSNTLLIRNFHLTAKFLPLKIWGILTFFWWDIPRIFLRMRVSKVVVLHKPLPSCWIYALLLRITFFPGKIVGIFDDWEGIGGFVSLRHPASLRKKLMVSFCEESFPSLCTHLHCVSWQLFQKMQLNPQTASKSFYLPNGSAVAPSPEPHPKDSPVRIIYVGTIKDQSVVDFLLDYTHKLLLTSQENSPWQFHVVGGGPLLPTLAQAFSTRFNTTHQPSPFVIHGALDHSDSLAAMRKSAIALLPLSDTFPLGLIDSSRSSTKLFEYMACGLAIVASATGEPLHILENNHTAILCKSNSEEFAQATQTLLANPDLRQTLAENCRQKFSIQFQQFQLMQRWLLQVGLPVP